VKEPLVRPSGKRGSLSSAMRWRTALAVCALFAPATSCATSPPCAALVASRPVTWRPPRLPTTDDPNDPFNICVISPDAPQCDDPRAPGASPRCDGRPGCGPDPTPRFDRCYREGGERKPLRVSTSRYSPRPGGACEHDGECRLGGCRDSCLSYQRPFYDFDCAISQVRYDPPTPTLPDRTDLLCGCLEGQCMFFSQ